MLKSLYREHQKTVIKNWFHPITMYIPTVHAPKTAKRGLLLGLVCTLERGTREIYRAGLKEIDGNTCCV